MAVYLTFLWGLTMFWIGQVTDGWRGWTLIIGGGWIAADAIGRVVW